MLNTCIERLMHTNLLMESDIVCCVEMHDLVLAFVLDMYSKGEHALIVNHGKYRLIKLPSTIGNFMELRLLDLTDCGNVRIDDGIL